MGWAGGAQGDVAASTEQAAMERLRPRPLPPLGRSLRQVVFARPTAVSGFPEDIGLDELVLSVHGRDGRQLGYVALRPGNGRSPWGGLTLSSELTLGDVRVLARSTELQLAAVGLERGAHHCLVSPSPVADPAQRATLAAEYHDALRPLREEGLCEIVFTEHSLVEPPVVAAALMTCAVETTLAAVERAGLDPGRSTVAVHRPLWAGAEVVQALSSRGLTPISSSAASLSTPADVLVLDGRPRRMGISEAHAMRARVVVALTPVVPTAAAARRLHDRRMRLLPYTATGAGRFLAIDLWRNGLAPSTAVQRAATVARERLACLVEAERSATPASRASQAISSSG